jgi:hypothetical protein
MEFDFRDRLVVEPKAAVKSGWRGIRTPGTVTRTAVFKTAALNHSAIHPVHAITSGRLTAPVVRFRFYPKLPSGGMPELSGLLVRVAGQGCWSGLLVRGDGELLPAALGGGVAELLVSDIPPQLLGDAGAEFFQLG